jgi:hypothetical protein
MMFSLRRWLVFLAGERALAARQAAKTGRGYGGQVWALR